MSLTNPSFETAGTNEYDADGWTVTVVDTNATQFAVFDTGTVGFAERGSETFGGWGTFYTGFSGFYVDLTPASFDLAEALSDFEDFEDLWGAGPAITEVADSGPWALVDGDTLTVSVNGEPEQTITFVSSQFHDIADARPEEAAIAINAELEDATAEVVGASIRLVTLRTGLGASIQVTGGTANAVLGFDTDPCTGTPVGGPFIATAEFSAARFGAELEEYDSFELEWASINPDDLLADPDDTLVGTRYDTILTADRFSLNWGDYDHSLGGGVSWTYPTFTGTGSVESFEGTWTAMSTL